MRILFLNIYYLHYNMIYIYICIRAEALLEGLKRLSGINSIEVVSDVDNKGLNILVRLSNILAYLQLDSNKKLSNIKVNIYTRININIYMSISVYTYNSI